MIASQGFLYRPGVSPLRARGASRPFVALVQLASERRDQWSLSRIQEYGRWTQSKLSERRLFVCFFGDMLARQILVNIIMGALFLFCAHR